MRIRLTLTLLLTLLAIPATAAPKPDLSLRRYLAHTDFVPRAAQGGMSNPPIVFQNQGIPLGISFTVNCSTGMTCSFVNGVMTMTAAGGGGFPRLDQVLDPTADKTFALGVNSLFFTTTNADGDHLSAGWQTANSHFVIASSTDVYPNMNRAPLFAQNVVGTIGDHSAGAAFGTGSELPAITADIQTVINGAGAKLATAASVEADPPAVVGAGASITEAAALWVPDFGYGNPPSGTHVYGLLVGDLSGWAGTDSIGVRVQDQSGSNWAIKTGLGKVEFGDNTSAPTYSTATNCSSAATPATCGSAAAGSVAVPTGITPTLVVNTTAITANSQILFTPDESLGTKLGVTCNSTIAQVAIEPIVTARTAATSFTIQYNTTITTNPICLSYLIIN